ncbi:hypothetical protein [Paenibacillus antarcticus]|uniref:Butirosin biosynthesis protein H N-terminal domain-containing protein n=1 Tax=Paenibacillus antarcticus TaxID=253703 RepID=A0A168MP07_9BACL|nr:hypothetical protein [Paenibacillus antarcticus]OAB44894.1 hypothetical protein PBAT_15045 [Paenibacillus antarcticus]
MSKLMTYVPYFYECRKTQLILLLHEQNLPVELLFYNSYESTQLFYNHLFVHNKSRWDYDGYSMTPESIMLLNIPLKEHYIDTEDELDLLLQENLKQKQFVYIWANLDYLPNWIYGKDYYINGSLHSVFLKDRQVTDDTTLYLLQDNYQDYCDYVDSSIIKNAIFKGNLEWTRIVTTVDLTGWDFKESQEAFEHRFMTWRQGLVDDFHLYDHIQIMIDQEPTDPHAFYEKLEHTLGLISGSRYLFSRFLEFINVSEDMVRRLDECSEIAERMKNAFAKAAIRGKVNQEKLSALCDKLKQLEIACFQILISDDFAPSCSENVPQKT